MKSNKIKVVAIVDAYSTGKYFAPFLHKRGYKTIHIKSSPIIPSFLLAGFSESNYINNFVYNGDLKTLQNKLDPYEILAIIPGTETAIPLTDCLAKEFGLPGNSPESSTSRRDKFEMIKTIKERGLSHASSVKSNNLEAIFSWHEITLQKEWPIVIKPLNSAGTDGVRFCHNNEEISSAVQALLGKKNRLGFLNEVVLVQSFLHGQEYVVNTVSSFSKHHLTDIRLCHKKRIQGAGFVSACEELIPASEPIVHGLKNYAFSALDALGVSHGPGHFEIMVTNEGPTIIEMGARVQGGIDPESNAVCFGAQQIDKSIDAYLEPHHFQSYCEQGYVLKKYGLWIFLISDKTGRIESIPLIDKIKSLPSFFSLKMNVKPGDNLMKTVDFYTSPGHVHLVSKSRDTLFKDMQAIREFEQSGYVISN